VLETAADATNFDNSGCTSITGWLFINGGAGTIWLHHLKSIGGLQMLGMTTKSGPAKLVLDALTSVAERIDIENNADLSDLEIAVAALQSLTVNQAFIVTDNPKLPQCMADRLMALVRASTRPYDAGNNSMLACN